MTLYATDIKTCKGNRGDLMEELINQAQEAIDNNDMEAYEQIQKKIKEKYKYEEQDSK